MSDHHEVDFAGLSDAEVARFAPATVAYAPGGSRRQAALAGIAPQSREYALWAWEQMHANLEVLFGHGVRHVVTPALTPTQLNEKGGYGRQVRDWVRRGMTGAEPLAYYRRAGWNVRLIGDLDAEFHAIAQELAAATACDSPRTLWWTITAGYEAGWEAALATGARTRDEAARALYAADLPPASLLIASGKPLLNTALLPPLLLAGDLHCYWIQRPGYVLDSAELRRILRDYAFLRPTWREDKTGRAEEALAHREAWERAPTLGLGRRLGPFWYPDAEQATEESHDDDLGR